MARNRRTQSESASPSDPAPAPTKRKLPAHNPQREERKDRRVRRSSHGLFTSRAELIRYSSLPDHKQSDIRHAAFRAGTRTCKNPRTR